MINGVMSKWFNISQGAHKVQITAMTLCCLCLNGLLTELRQLNTGCQINVVFAEAA